MCSVPWLAVAVPAKIRAETTEMQPRRLAAKLFWIIGIAFSRVAYDWPSMFCNALGISQ